MMFPTKTGPLKQELKISDFWQCFFSFCHGLCRITKLLNFNIRHSLFDIGYSFGLFPQYPNQTTQRYNRPDYFKNNKWDVV